VGHRARTTDFQAGSRSVRGEQSVGSGSRDAAVAGIVGPGPRRMHGVGPVPLVEEPAGGGRSGRWPPEPLRLPHSCQSCTAPAASRLAGMTTRPRSTRCQGPESVLGATRSRFLAALTAPLPPPDRTVVRVVDRANMVKAPPRQHSRRGGLKCHLRSPRGFPRSVVDSIRGALSDITTPRLDGTAGLTRTRLWRRLS